MRIEKFSISKQIETNFKDYAMYTLKHRGIPEFEDSLTNVQRLILLATKYEFNKTITIVGDVIKMNYHHGNQALEKSINRLARPYNIANQLLEGDGFFGTYVNPVPSAARYTSVKINSKVREVINEFAYLNKIDVDDTYMPLNITIPLGLLIPTIGIAVGYKTLILPRALNDLQDFINGKKSKCDPTFINYPKKLFKKIKNEKFDAWLFESQLDIDDKLQTICVSSLPPMLRYDNFIKKLDKIIDASLYKSNPVIDVINNSKDLVDILITMKTKNHDDFKLLCDRLKRITSIIVQEKIIFIKEGKVLEYSCIEDYLKDFKIKNEMLYLKDIEYNINKNKAELNYQNVKLDFLKFIFGNKRTEQEINEFYNKYPKEISTKLDTIKARNITKEEMEKTKITIKNLNETILENKIKYKEKETYINTLNINLHNVIDSSSYDFEELDIIDGIEIYNAKDEIEEYFED